MRTKPIIFLLLLLCSFTLHSHQVEAAGWTTSSIVKQIHFYDFGIYIQLDTNVVSNINSCSTWNGFFVIHDQSAQVESAFLSAVLLAKSTGKTIKIYSATCYADNNSADAFVADE